MTIQQWADEILLVKLEGEPAFSEEMNVLRDRLDSHASDVVIDLSEVRTVNSSNIAQMLRARQQLADSDRRLILAGASDSVWSVMGVTGLDKVFDFAQGVPTALASLGMDRQAG